MVLTKFMSDKQNLTTKNSLVKKRFNDMYLEEIQTRHLNQIFELLVNYYLR